VKNFIFIILLSYLPAKAYPCSMFLKDYEEWGAKVTEYEKLAIEQAKTDSDTIVVVRALSSRSPSEREEGGTIVEELVVDGPNPRVGELRTVHEVRVLEVLKGSIKKGDVITVNVVEPESYSLARCAGPSYEMVTNVDSFDDTFKYLMYLKERRVLRINMFTEWPESITAEREYQLLTN